MNQCPLCQNNSTTTCVEHQSDYDILYCSNCQIQFSNPMTDPGGAFYQQSPIYEGRSTDTYNKLPLPIQDWRYKSCLKLCNSKPNQSLLDIGCGDGGFIALAQSRGYNVFGIDIDDRAVDLAKNIRGIENITSGNWEKIQNEEGWRNFDIITLFDVLEHVASPISLITQVFDLLKPGGVVCITVPRLDRYPKLFDSEVDVPPHHFTLWTPNALNVLFKEAGFVETSIIKKPLMAEDFVVHLIWRLDRYTRRLTKKDNKPHIIVRVVRKCSRLISFPLTGIVWLLRISNIGQGHTLLALAKKP